MRLPLFIIKYTHYEYWPMTLFYLPILPYWLFLSIKNKSLAYFTIANPGIELGGFFGESKTDILNLINEKYKPRTIEIDRISFTEIFKKINDNDISYPFIAKPDVGERGNSVCKIRNEEELKRYNIKIKSKYIIQEFIDYDIELGVLYSRLPNEDKGKVSSITLKEFLSVTGNGTSTILELMQESSRARFQIKRLTELDEINLHEVLPNGVKKVLEPIGNHCRGTRFIDVNHLISPELNLIFDTICKDINGFYFGRFDLKVKSIDDFNKGINIKIMELNGASSEPGHIYDADINSIFSAYRDLMYHWKRISDISKINQKAGYKPVSFNVIAKSYLQFAFPKN